MGRILSQEEIDALLLSPGKPLAVRREAGAEHENLRYNFRRPDRVSKEQIHSVQLLHDRFARNVATSLSAYLRSVIDFTVVSVEQFAYSEFLMSLADPTAFYALAIPPLSEPGALEINPTVAFAIIDRMLGGTGRATAPPRALTDIEQNVADQVVKILLESLSETWKSIVDVRFEIRGRDTRPQMLQVAGPNETVLMVAFELSIGDARGTVSLCLPVSIVESAGSYFAQAWNRQRREPSATEREWMQDHLASISMPVSASVESRLSTRELLALRAGDVVSLGVPANRLIDVHVGSTLKFKGRLTADDGRLAVQIDQRLNGAGLVEA